MNENGGGDLRIDLWRIALFEECAGRKNPRDGKGNVKRTTKTEVSKF